MRHHGANLIHTGKPATVPGVARVLRPGGWLAVAYPGPHHLIELRDGFGLLRQNEANFERTADMAARVIGPPSVRRLHRRAVLDPEATRAVILMGPNARHIDPASLDVGADPFAVTFDINVIFAQRTETSS
jgi:23S rRNA (guanine745-N1)-methyltransferase